MSSLSIIHCIHTHGDARRQKRGDKDRYGASWSGLVGGLSSLSPSHTPSLSLSSCLLHFHVQRDDVASRIKWLKIKLQLSQRGTWASDECGWIKWLATRHLSHVCFIESEFFCLRRVQLDVPLLYVGLFCFRQSYFIPQKRCEESSSMCCVQEYHSTDLPARFSVLLLLIPPAATKSWELPWEHWDCPWTH